MSVTSPGSRIELSGDLTISSMNSLHERITAAFMEDGPIEIVVDDNADVDISFVQLIESARNTAKQRGVTLALAAPAEGQLLNTLMRGGFIDEKSGSPSPFWQGGH